ncbi:MAG: Gfo/Idh/MocA family oxidoreductase, partial [Lentisphaeria bacterium]|nr:Gfo/Idh/MocA family oxidoreductase [Lentisphaeria bacterium]
MSNPVKLAVLGAGARGRGYSTFAASYPERLQIYAVAEPDDRRREYMAKTYNIPAERCFKTWQEFCQQPKMCDGVIISTQDEMHEAPAVACANLKYHILLEKPMAPTAEACRNIVNAVKANGVMFAVCHVLRYTKYTRALKEIIQSGEIGEVVSIQH